MITNNDYLVLRRRAAARLAEMNLPTDLGDEELVIAWCDGFLASLDDLATDRAFVELAKSRLLHGGPN